MKKIVLPALLAFISFIATAQLPQDYTFPVKVDVNNNALSITLSWPANADAQTYTIKRKEVNDFSALTPFTTIGSINSNAGTSTSFTDQQVTTGILYEYEITGTFLTTQPLSRNQYVCAGIIVNPVHNRGAILILCESHIQMQVTATVEQLVKDLAGDGWTVLLRYADSTASPASVKNIIHNIYLQSPDLKQVLLIGHIPVPYSGNINPDGHTNHIGCWPSDGYYGDMTSNWTDTITSYSVPTTRPQNINIPGDGKFDQDSIGAAQLAVGRIDFANLPAFGVAEAELINRYLAKNHAFRTGNLTVQKRALIEDNFPGYAEKFSQSAWKSYAALVGYDNVINGQYESYLLFPGGFLWSYGNGAGTYTGASGIGNTNDFVSNAYQTVFTQLFGSYFGDWDSQDNYMRASLASSGYTLTCVWGGRPHWYFHHMGAGMPIGYSARLSMSNRGIYQNTGNAKAQVHMALMGDPSLRSSYIKPVSGFQATVNNGAANLKWSLATETNISGYYIYRSRSIAGPFNLLNSTPVTDTSFTDNQPFTGVSYYMIRLAKMDTMNTASALYGNNTVFYNLSPGAFADIYIADPVVAPVLRLYQLNSFSDLDHPKFIAIEGKTNTRYFVAERNAVVKVYDSLMNYSGIYLSTPDMGNGFFSMAFHPDFRNNKLLYVLYTNSDGNIELDRYREGNEGYSAFFDGRLLTIPVTNASKNLGGDLHFDADGYLYVSTGDADEDNAQNNFAQDSNSLAGKILRILPDTSASPASYYSIPESNPYSNEIFATGLRFPYRWSYDSTTQDMWIADRGNNSTEEINRVSLSNLRAANFGWRCFDGNMVYNNTDCRPAANYIFPSVEYSSPDPAGGSVTGGVVYRGNTFTALKGFYICADSYTGNFYLVKYDPNNNQYSTSTQLLVPGGISDISEDPNGEIYVTSLTGGVYRLEADGERVYRFLGNGDWDNPSNWSLNTVPPSILPAGSAIIIDPVGDGACRLNSNKVISPGASITVNPGKNLIIEQDLKIQ